MPTRISGGAGGGGGGEEDLGFGDCEILREKTYKEDR